jgi:hypothetical protein
MDEPKASTKDTSATRLPLAKRSTRNAKISRLSKGAQSIAYDEED